MFSSHDSSAQRFKDTLSAAAEKERALQEKLNQYAKEAEKVYNMDDE